MFRAPLSVSAEQTGVKPWFIVEYCSSAGSFSGSALAFSLSPKEIMPEGTWCCCLFSNVKFKDSSFACLEMKDNITQNIATVCSEYSKWNKEHARRVMLLNDYELQAI